MSQEPTSKSSDSHDEKDSPEKLSNTLSEESNEMEVDANEPANENKSDEDVAKKESESVSDAEEDDAKEDNDENDGEANTEDAEQTDPIFDKLLLKPLFERREKSLKELLDSMDEFSPIIPDAVTDYYLTKSGFKTSDHRIKRLLALATQKFVSDIANDAYQFSRIRAQTANAAGGAGRGRAGPGSTSGRTVLTMESLSGVLGDYGINAKRPDFYR